MLVFTRTPWTRAGLDDIALTLHRAAEITAYEARVGPPSWAGP